MCNFKNRILICLPIFLLLNCSDNRVRYPFKDVRFFPETEVINNNIEIITIPLKSNLFLITKDKEVIKSIVNNFRVEETRECLGVYQASKKWAKNPVEPFKYRDKLQNGDILFRIKDRKQLGLLGISYCKEATTNLDDFSDRMELAERKDTLIAFKAVQMFLDSLGKNQNLFLRKQFTFSEDQPAEISYYRIIKKNNI